MNNEKVTEFYGKHISPSKINVQLESSSPD